MNNIENETLPAVKPSLLSLMGYLLASVILVHIFGLFGVFIALAYPLWWFFFPQSSPCFFCLHTTLRKKHSQCPVCKRDASQIYDPPFRSVLFNMLAIFALSLFSFFILFVEINLFGGKNVNIALFLQGQRAQFVMPEKNQFPMGKEFYIDLGVKDIKKPVNVVQADLQFRKDLFRVKKIDVSGSFATIFTQKDFSNLEGWMRVVGGLPNPGFVGDYGVFVRIYFEPVKPGIGEITFMPTSKILANDGKGTNIAYRFTSSSVIITSNKENVLGAPKESNTYIK